MTRPNPNPILLPMVALIALTALVAPAHAQTYTRLQILLPGETADPGSPSGKQGTPTAQVVDTAFDLVVRAVDDQWNVVPSVTSQVELSSTDQTAALPGPFSLSNGTAMVQVTSGAAGNYSFTADDLTDVTIQDATSAVVTTLQLQGFEFSRINQKNQYAGQAMTITLDAINPVGNIVSGFNGQVSLQQLTSYGDGRIEPSVVTLQNGRWTGDVTMYRADNTSINRGNVNIYAFLPQDPTRNGTSDPFNVHPGNYTRIQIVVPGQLAAPGTVSGLQGDPASQGSGDTFEVQVFATDDYWNPVESSNNFRITSTDGTANTPVNGSLSAGIGTALISLGAVGSPTLTVTDMTSGSIQGMTSAPIPVTSGSVDQFVVDPFPVPVTAGDAVTVTIRATDMATNTITEYQGDGVLTANTGPGSISPTAISFVDGVWTGQITFRGAGGAVALTCADYSSPPHSGTSAPFVVQAGPFAGLQVLAPGQAPAGGTETGRTGLPDEQNAGSSFSLRVRAVDAFWNRVPDNTARVSLRSSDAFASLGDTITLSNGEANVPATLFAAGGQTVVATDIDDGSIESHASDPIPVLAGTYARLLLLAPGESLAPGTEDGKTGEATDQSINYQFTLSGFAADTWGNPVGGVTDVVSLASPTDALAELPDDYALVDGVAESLVVRMRTGGLAPQELTLSNVTDPSIQSSTSYVHVINSGLRLVAFVGANAESDTVIAGEPFPLTVQAVNVAGAVIQEFNDAVAATAIASDPGVETRGRLPFETVQLSNGQRVVDVSYEAAEVIQIRVEGMEGNPPVVTEAVTVLPAAPDAIELTSDPAWVRGGREATVTASVVDAFGNGVPDRPVEFVLLSGAGSLSALSDSTDVAGGADALFTAPRRPEIALVQATSGIIVAHFEIETALVDPNEPSGTVTNYPNPFHPGEAPTTVAYKISDDARVRIRLYTLMGNLVREEVFALGQPGGVAGLNEWQWDGRNGDGDVVASGGYVLQIDATGDGETLHSMRRKIAVVR